MKDITYNSAVKEIKERVSILTLVENYVSLKKAGKSHMGLCPFHEEKTPSFHVSEDRGVFHCFGCGAGGDIFGFLMQHKKLSFPEALEELAKRAGVKLEKSSEPQKKPAANNLLLRINALTSAFYHKLLLETEEGLKAKNYLAGRGITIDTIKEFGLGYAPADWDRLAKFFATKKVPMPLAEQLGLLIKRPSSDGYYDRFRDRVMFPIRDVEGKVIGFGGRVLGSEQPKYMNSPESPVYHKRSTFYGLDKSREHVRRKETALVVEGYMDFLSLYRADIKNVVATLGTSLTRDHAKQLRRYADKVVIVFDGDEAGQNASLKVLDVFLEEGISPRMVLMPEKEDPASFISAGKQTEFKKLAENAPPLLDFFIEKTAEGFKQSRITRKRAIEDTAHILGKMKDTAERSYYIKKTAVIFGVREDELFSIMKFGERIERKADFAVKRSPDVAEKLILKVLFNFPDFSGHLTSEENLIDTISDEELKPVFEEIVLRGFDGISSLLSKFSDSSTQSTLSEIVFSSDNIPDETAALRLLKDCIRTLKLRKLEDSLRILRLEIGRAANENNSVLEKNLMKEYRDLRRRGTDIKGENYENQEKR